LNELVSNRLCNELGSTAVSQELLFKNFIDFVSEFNGNLNVDVMFGHVHAFTLNLFELALGLYSMTFALFQSQKSADY